MEIQHTAFGTNALGILSMKSISSKRGFTLIELLVVITIIVIASSIIFVAGGGGDGAALNSSQRIISGIAQGARGQAILKNARTRLIIHNNPTNPDKYLRFFGIVYEDPDNQGEWIAATQGTYLPEGIYFDASKSGERSFSIPYPYAVSTASVSAASESFYYFEFNSNGTMATSFNNSRLIFRAATLRPGSPGSYEIEFPTASVDPEKEYIAAGLIFRRVGTTTLIDDPEVAIRQ